MFKNIKNRLMGKYTFHNDAVIISCFYNPYNNEYRLKAFKKFYDSIKHLNHRIIECVIGDAEPQLEKNENILRTKTKDILWHKETLLNKIIKDLPKKLKYVFWVDADVFFTNKNWILQSVEEFKNGARILQPFEYCVHLNRDEEEPSFDMDYERERIENRQIPRGQYRMWRSFCANHADPHSCRSDDVVYDYHGHVGFAWGATRELLDAVPLYERALIGGADHIIAHAAAGQIPHTCINNAFKDNIDEIEEWSHEFYDKAQGQISFVKGDLFHMWHGDLKNRQYLKRIQDFTPTTRTITKRDRFGMFVSDHPKAQAYMDEYMRGREIISDPEPVEPVFVAGGGDFAGGGASADFETPDSANTENAENFS